MECALVKDLLVPFVDGECAVDEAREVAEHLKDCVSCREEKRCLESLDASVRATFRAAGAALSWERFWPRLSESLEVKPRETHGFFDSFSLPFGLRGAWAVAGAAILVVGISVLSWIFVVGERANGGSNLTRVESIDAFGADVAVFRMSQDRTTVIWLFDETQGDDGHERAEPSQSGTP